MKNSVLRTFLKICCFPIFILLHDCKTPDYSNVCDMDSETFLATIFLKISFRDSSGMCGLGFGNLGAGSNPIVATPAFSPSAGAYSTTQNISMSTATSGATIYYTIDGTTPTTSSTVFTNSFHIWPVAGKTIKAYAVKSGIPDSTIATGIFSYVPLKTGQVTSYATGDDANLNHGVAISNSGPTAHSVYTSDYTTTDNSTGVVWKSCSEGLSGPTCAIGGISATSFAILTTACSALNSVNGGMGYAGRTTWRLPTMKELLSTDDASKTSVTIFDTVAFPGTANFAYWSSTPYSANGGFGWYLDYSQGNSYATTNTNPYHARCVAGSGYTETQSFTDNGNGTVKDNTTGLIWQKCSNGQNNDSTCSGAATTIDWPTALTYCSSLSLASKSWRLPNRSELTSLYDYTKSAGPTIDQVAFPSTVATASGYYWTSTTYAPTTTAAWYVNFTTTFNNIYDQQAKVGVLNVRCVTGP